MVVNNFNGGSQSGCYLHQYVAQQPIRDHYLLWEILIYIRCKRKIYLDLKGLTRLSLKQILPIITFGKMIYIIIFVYNFFVSYSIIDLICYGVNVDVEFEAMVAQWASVRMGLTSGHGLGSARVGGDVGHTW